MTTDSLFFRDASGIVRPRRGAAGVYGSVARWRGLFGDALQLKAQLLHPLRRVTTRLEIPSAFETRNAPAM